MQIEVLQNEIPLKKISNPKKTLILGRSAKADVSVDVDGLSRNHMQIEQIGDEIFVTDLNSTNGVYVNNERIPAGEKVKYLSILPLQIGTLNINIKTDDQVLTEKSQELASSQTMSSISSMNMRSASMSSRPSRDSEKTEVTKKFKKSEKKKSSFSNLIVLIALAGGGYFYYTNVIEEKMNNPETETDSQAKNSDQNESKKKLRLVDVQDLKSLSKKALCSSSQLATICKDLELVSDNGEGVIIKENIAFIFILKDSLKPKLETEELKKLSVDDQNKFYLITKFLSPKKIELFKSLNVDMIQAAVINQDQGIKSIGNTIGVAINTDYKIDDGSFINAMDYALYNGNATYYNQFISSKLITR
jgi:pSer/pThr/pTyr-binding forkhead associated (FHA) protein